MRKKIFRNMCAVAFCAILTVLLVYTFFYYRDLQKRVLDDERNTMALIRNSVEKGGLSYLKSMENQSEYRITYISVEGAVLYDSFVEEEQWEDMVNHYDRPEVAKAREEGFGYHIRTSDTLDTKAYYYAEKMSDGNIIRMAVFSDSVMSYLARWLPQLLLVILIVLLFAFWISKMLTKRIVAPINAIDFDNISADVYDELYPFLDKITKQRDVIARQVHDILASRTETETIMENMSEGLIVLDKEECIISYNESAKKIMDTEPVYGEKLIRFNRNENLLHIVEDALHGEHGETVLHTEIKVYQLYASPVIVEKEITGAVVIIVDATEKEKREELRREFSANVSHELKTPLTSISGYAEIMENGMVQGEDVLKFAAVIHNEAQRMISLVDDIIKLSRLDEKQVELEWETIALHDMISENVTRLEAMAKKRNVQILENNENCYIYGVRQIIDEMVHNLLENAIKYNVENGTVKISVNQMMRERNMTVMLSVEDTGIGIPQEDKERVFERFYRVDKSHSKEIGGTGLGLSIVKHGAMYHDAQIEMQSELGKGTIVKLFFQPHSK